MSAIVSLDVCKSYLDCQARCERDAILTKRRRLAQPFVTISRQAGAGGITIGQKLIESLQKKDKSATCPWTAFDKELVAQVLKEHDLPCHLGKYMPEEKISESQDFFEELFNIHPSHWTLVHKASETILHLAQMGSVVLVGRGANIITRKLPLGFHVRLVGSLKKRVQHIMEYYQLTLEEAMRFVEREDRGRRDYLRKHFSCDIDDPLIYDLIINTDLVSYQETADLISSQVLWIQERRKNHGVVS